MLLENSVTTFTDSLIKKKSSTPIYESDTMTKRLGRNYIFH